MNNGQLSQAPVPWEYQGETYMLGHTDIGLELLFQGIHETWARNRLESRRGKMSEDAFDADHDKHLEHLEGNRFAFGGRLSLAFLWSSAGQFEYLLLKLQKGSHEKGAQVKRDWLASVQREDKKEWDRLVSSTFRHDFPNLFPAEEATSPSLPPGTPTPSTSESTPS